MKTYTAVDDSADIQKHQIEKFVRELSVSYSQIRFDFLKNRKIIVCMLDEHSVTKAVGFTASLYRLPKKFVKRVGYNADIKCPAMMQLTGAISGNHSRLLSGTMYFRKTCIELCSIPRYRLLHMIAHELAHVRMHLDTHALARSEFSTDLVALMVTGNNQNEYLENMFTLSESYGYIRRGLIDEVFRCLAKYAPTIYLE